MITSYLEEQTYMESLVLICTILGGFAACVAIITYRKDHITKPKEELEFLKVQFLSNRSLSISVTDQLEKYCQDKDAYEELILPDTTIKKYIELLKHSQSTNLSVEILEEAIELSPTSPMIQSMTKSLEQQFNELQKIDGWIKTKLIEV